MNTYTNQDDSGRVWFATRRDVPIILGGAADMCVDVEQFEELCNAAWRAVQYDPGCGSYWLDAAALDKIVVSYCE